MLLVLYTASPGAVVQYMFELLPFWRKLKLAPMAENPPTHSLSKPPGACFWGADTQVLAQGGPCLAPIAATITAFVHNALRLPPNPVTSLVLPNARAHAGSAHPSLVVTSPHRSSDILAEATKGRLLVARPLQKQRRNLLNHDSHKLHSQNLSR